MHAFIDLNMLINAHNRNLKAKDQALSLIIETGDTEHDVIMFVGVSSIEPETYGEQTYEIWGGADEDGGLFLVEGKDSNFEGLCKDLKEMLRKSL